MQHWVALNRLAHSVFSCIASTARVKPRSKPVRLGQWINKVDSFTLCVNLCRYFRRMGSRAFTSCGQIFNERVLGS